MMVSF